MAGPRRSKTVAISAHMTHEQKQIMDRLASFSGVSSSLYLTNLAV